ncbi:MAG TPA: exodeoxyribonuclease V subunit gamma [Acidimicrobiales bacterium]|nr:exodeoxyribonuclease V subunit gamma [Acidimicrobiales bacterium]
MLILHRSERADLLVDALGQLLAQPLDDPVTPEVVAVPTRGVERWITQRLARHLGSGRDPGHAPDPDPAVPGGICANVGFPFPGTLVGQATACATGVQPDLDPWLPERLAWAVIDVIDRGSGDGRLAPLLEHLAAVTPPARPGSPASPLRRFATARHLADLFDRYGVHRPEMIRAWAAGSDEGVAPGGADWQPHLWRLVRARIGVPSPAERLAAAVERMRSDPALLDLPARVSVFGLTRLPAGHLAVLDAVAAHRDVHLFLLHPSGQLWQRIAPEVAGRGAAMPRSEDPSARRPRHPLLRSWGRDAREMQIVLSATAADDSRHYQVPETPPATLLERLQADIRADRSPGGPDAGTEPSTVDPGDRSLQIHACHGRTRQVEVLRDAILHLLQEDPTLEARDVIVMCPDIEVYAPLIQAAFGVDAAVRPDGRDGTGPTHGPPAERPADRSGPVLRVRLADRSLRQTNPLLGVASVLLELAGSRLTAPAVVDLAARSPVSRRFSFDQEDLATIERWVSGTAVRWGFDAAHRRPWSLEALGTNTWAAGMDRLMLGVAMTGADGGLFAGTLPYGEIDSSDIDLAGRWAEMVERLGAGLDRLQGPHPIDGWIAALVEVTEAMACPARDEAWQHDEFQATLTAVAADAHVAGAARPGLSLSEVRALLGEQLKGRPTRANFRTGDLTICTMVPMRSVPHRVVALLGLDDGAFPRHPEIDGDDLLLSRPLVGDRDARSEDRQLLLDALLAATSHLIITYCGRDERTNRRRPPCAPVAELLDVVDASVRRADGRAARHSVVVHHPLQPYDPWNFTPGGLAPDGPWGFDPVFLAGARAMLQPDPPGLVDEPLLPDPAEDVIGLDQLVVFVQHPARAFLRRRLSLYLGDWSDELDDRMPLELGPLERWALGDRLLEAVLSGVEIERAVEAELHRGLTPPGVLAVNVLSDVGGGVAALVTASAARGFPPGASEAAQVQVELAGGRSLAGAIPQVRGDTVIQCVYSRLGPKHRLAAWVRLLALTADRPERPVAALSIGRGDRGAIRIAEIGPLGGSEPDRRAQALDHLAELVDLYDRGMREPLPMACGASSGWAEGRRRGLDEDGLIHRARAEWDPSGEIPGERDQPEHVFQYGRDSDVRVLLSAPPRGDESGFGWAAEERHRFGRLARRLWDPLLSREVMETR